MRALQQFKFASFVLSILFQSVAESAQQCRSFFNNGGTALSSLLKPSSASENSAPDVLEPHRIRAIRKNRDFWFYRNQQFSANERLLMAMFNHQREGDVHGQQRSFIYLKFVPSGDSMFLPETGKNLPRPLQKEVQAMADHFVQQYIEHFENFSHMYNHNFFLKMIQLQTPALQAENLKFFREKAKLLANHSLSLFFSLDKLDHFVDQSIKKAMGESYEPVFEFKYAEGRTYILSTNEITGLEHHKSATYLLPGIHYFVKPLEQIGSVDYAFKLGTKDAVLSISTKKSGSLSPMMKPRTHFGTKFKNGKLAGAILIGLDMSEQKELAQEYKAYYRSRGFTFKPRYLKKGFFETFADRVISGEISYFLKEDNGSEKFTNDVNILEGIKKTSRRIESVYIVTTTEANKDQEITLSTDYVKILANGLGDKPLVYINSTCYKCQFLDSYVSEVKNPNFTYIAPKEMAETFTYESTTPLLYLLDGIRNNQSFAETLANMESNKTTDNETYASDNNYILPIGPRYKSNVSAIHQQSVIRSFKLKVDGKVIEESEEK